MKLIIRFPVLGLLLLATSMVCIAAHADCNCAIANDGDKQFGTSQGEAALDKRMRKYDKVYDGAEQIIVLATFSLTVVLVVGLFFSYKELTVIKEESARLKKEADHLVAEKQKLLLEYKEVKLALDNFRNELTDGNKKLMDGYKADVDVRLSKIDHQLRKLMRSEDVMTSGILDSIFQKLAHGKIIDRDTYKEILDVITEASLSSVNDNTRAGALFALRANGTPYALGSIKKIIVDPKESEYIKNLAIEAYGAIVARHPQKS